MKTVNEPSQLLETLEARIAPASATFVDVDGDVVKVTTTKGTDADLQTIVDNGENMGQMETLALTSTYAGSNVKFAVTSRADGGDGLVNVWHINASGFDLGAVEVAGDLAKLTVGDANYANGSVKSVKVQSIGVNGGAADKVWLMAGSTSTFNVAGDVDGATLAWTINTTDKLTVNSIVIGGNLTGGTADSTGSVILTGGTGGTAELKSISIGGNLTATDYNKSGSIIVGNPASASDYTGIIGKVSIGGSMTGDNNHTYSGAIFAANTIGAVTVGGSLTGGDEGSGSIFGYQKITGDVKIGGSVYGGSGIQSGAIFSYYGTAKNVTIEGTLSGGSGAYSGSVSSSLGSVGNVTVGSYLDGGSGVFAGSIYGETGLGNVSVGGSVFGGSNDNTGFIGTDTGNATNYIAGNITIQGDLYGGSDFSSGVIAAGTAGNISIYGSMVGGNTVAGTGSIYILETLKSLNVTGDLEGTSKDSSASIKILGGANDTAKVSSVTIGGTLAGDAGASSGAVVIEGSVDKFTIGGGIGGGSGANSGSLTFGTIKTLKIGTGASIVGSIYGGSASGAGSVTGETLGTAILTGNIVGGSASTAGKFTITETAKDITLSGNLYGGSATDTGIIEAAFITGKLTVGGNVSGSDNVSNTGLITVGGNANAIEIKGNLVGGDTTMGNKTNSGAVLVTGMLKSMTVGGDIQAGTYFSTSTNNTLGAVRAGIIDTMLVKGSLVGPDANSRVMITAQGDTTKTSGTNLAIKSLTVLGSVSNAMILGGYNTTGTTIGGAGGNDGGGAQLGTITINGDFFNGSIATGVSNDAATLGNWADGTNTLLDTNPLVASIAKIVIKGSCFAGTQSGVSAELIKSLSVGGFLVPIGAGAQFIDPISGNFKAQQVVA